MLCLFDICFIYTAPQASSFKHKPCINKVALPLPFTFNKCFTKYPKEIPDYFKQAFPEGLSWERSMTFEDGAFAAVSAQLR